MLERASKFQFQFRIQGRFDQLGHGTLASYQSSTVSSVLLTAGPIAPLTSPFTNVYIFQIVRFLSDLSSFKFSKVGSSSDDADIALRTPSSVF